MGWTKWDHNRLHDGCGGEDGCEQPDAPPCTKKGPEEPGSVVMDHECQQCGREFECEGGCTVDSLCPECINGPDAPEAV